MKYSQLFGKSNKSPVKDSKFVSHQLLVKGGFIAESSAGRYFFLPLGWRVHDKIKNLIKQHMDAAGAQEMLSPTLHPLELWQETNRTNTVGFELMTVKDRRGAAFALGGTAEEMFVDVVRKFQISYKDLPFTLYQFSNKFRDEMRARGGLLRVREFVMKDGYSFDMDSNAFKQTYDTFRKVYSDIFSAVGLKTHVVDADNGYIGGEFCHEFQVEHPDGEGTFYVSSDGSYTAHEDVASNFLAPVNPDEEPKKMEIIDQPEWVQTMENNQKHYGKDARFFLKNVVYRSTQGDVIIVTIRGDLEVNKTKVEKVLTLTGQLLDATAEDLAAIGTKTGYVHSWGHQFTEPRTSVDGSRQCKVIYVADLSLKTVVNFIGGQKEVATDSVNVNYGRDFKHEIEADVATAQEGLPDPSGKGTLTKKQGIEVGNIFQLGTHYTSKMARATFTDQEGAEQPFYMGCYGIGLGRTLAAIVEVHHDEKGITWPERVAPFRFHLISLPGGEVAAQTVYETLLAANQEVIWDDRATSAGEKFADADLLGCPYRLICSSKTGEQIEVKKRTETASELIDLHHLPTLIK
ncbi:proline--tRNA ligase [Candidatus Woesebacteria bacterium]|nr:proline--tRNA ligase [Candidatus Woesebacteria bacterium]